MAGGPHRDQSAANEPGHHLLLPYEHLIIDSKNVPWCKILVLSTISVIKKLNTNTHDQCEFDREKVVFQDFFS